MARLSVGGWSDRGMPLLSWTPLWSEWLCCGADGLGALWSEWLCWGADGVGALWSEWLRCGADGVGALWTCGGGVGAAEADRIVCASGTACGCGVGATGVAE